MFHNKRNLLIIKNILGINLTASRDVLRFGLINKGNLMKRFSTHVNKNNSEDHGHGHGKGGNHLDHDDHDDHHGHHEITGEVDLNKVYVPISADKSKYISMIGVSQNHKHITYTIENENKAYNQITPIAVPLITRSRVYFKDLANVTYEDNPYFHSEPYGYLVSDDPFDPNPTLYQTLFLMAIAFFAIMFMGRIFRMNNFDDYKVLSQEIYHAHYTANLIEDEIRKIRKEDYPWRKRYDDLKKEKIGSD